ncbi:MAG: hypothetical protein ACOZAA_11715 [Pseudomonadota bacterium]
MSTKALLYTAASLASLGSYALHAFAGGAWIARPFYREASAHGVRTHAFRYCWHFISAALIAIGAGFAFLAAAPQHWPLGVFLTISTAAYCILSIVIARIEKAPALKSPPTLLCALIAAIGAAALFAN